MDFESATVMIINRVKKKILAASYDKTTFYDLISESNKTTMELKMLVVMLKS